MSLKGKIAMRSIMLYASEGWARKNQNAQKMRENEIVEMNELQYSKRYDKKYVHP